MSHSARGGTPYIPQSVHRQLLLKRIPLRLEILLIFSIKSKNLRLRYISRHIICIHRHIVVVVIKHICTSNLIDEKFINFVLLFSYETTKELVKMVTDFDKMREMGIKYLDYWWPWRCYQSIMIILLRLISNHFTISFHDPELCYCYRYSLGRV